MKLVLTILAVLVAAAVVGSPPPEYDVRVSISDAVVKETSLGATAVFTVGVVPPSNQSIAVSWHTEDVTAAGGDDYQALADVLVLPPGIGKAQITIPIFPDNLPEATEIFFVHLTSAVHADIDDGLGHGIIRDPSGPRFNAKFDLNRDGRSDILVTYGPVGPTHTEDHIVWSVDGTGATPPPGGPPPPPGPSTASPDPEARLVAFDDLDRDGELDALWMGPKGQWWLDTEQLEVTAPGQLVGTGDFNLDGAVDLLFWDALTGKLGLWESSTSFPFRKAIVQDRGTNAPWEPIAVARLGNAGGMADILWQHTETRTLEYWHMTWHVVGDRRELVLAYDNPLQPPLPESNDGILWRLVGAGDFDGDGLDDLLWYHEGRKRVAVWFMRKAERRTSGAVPLSPDTFDYRRSDGILLTDWGVVGPR